MIDLIYGFTNKSNSDMSLGDTREKYLSNLGLGEGVIILPEQAHGSQVAVVDSDLTDKVVNDVDGLVYKRREGDKGVALGVLTADCVPILAVDLQKQIIGVAHAGWRGSLLEVGGKLIEKMTGLGARVDEIDVYLGPRIGICCYNVEKMRAENFRDRFNDEFIVNEYEGKVFLDLARVNYLTLIKYGVRPEKIRAMVSCTSCQNKDYFSFRATGGVELGRQMGYIGYKS